MMIKLYYNDKSYLSRIKKDCISVSSENWRVLNKKRLILYNLKKYMLHLKHNLKIKQLD